MVIADCDIPLFLREKYYADFRKDFDKPFAEIMESLQKFLNISQDRFDTPEYFVDWSTDVANLPDGNLQVRYNLFEHAQNRPFSIVSTILASLNAAATRRYRELTENGFEWFARATITLMLMGFLSENDLRIQLHDANPVLNSLGFRDPKRGIEIDISIETRWLGQDTGKTIIFDLSGQVMSVAHQMMSKTRKLTPEEREKLGALVRAFA